MSGVLDKLTRLVDKFIDAQQAPTPHGSANKRAFFDACKHGEDATVRRTLRLYPDAVEWKDAANHNFTGLMHALVHGRTSTAELLLKTGKGVNAVDNSGTSPLIAAVLGGIESENVYTLLFKHGAKINHANHIGRTALMYAAQLAEERVLRILLEENPRLDMTDRSGDSAEDLAEIAQRQVHLKVLKEAKLAYEAQRKKDITVFSDGIDNAMAASKRLRLQRRKHTP